MVQGSVYMLFALGMIFILLLGEIDLSIGFIGGVAGVVMALLVFGDERLSLVGRGDRRACSAARRSASSTASSSPRSACPPSS